MAFLSVPEVGPALQMAPVQSEKHYGIDAFSDSQSPRRVSAWRQCLNILCCLLSLPLYFLLTVSTKFPITLDLIMTIMLTELNRLINERRRQKLSSLQNCSESPIQEKEDWLQWELNVERGAPRLDCVAAVVGWREDPSLFHRALSSYSSASGCVFLLVGVDGDSPEDEDMVNVFNEVRWILKAPLSL